MKKLKSQSGNTLIFILAFLALLGLLALDSYRSVNTLIKLQELDLHSKKTELELHDKLLDSFSSKLQVGQNTDCINSKESHGRVKIEKSLCYKFLPTTSKSLNFNFNKLFKNPATCQLNTDKYFNQSSSGFKLSSTAIRALATCSKPPSGVWNRYVIEGNLALNKPIEVKEVDKNNFNIIAATGYIDINTEVSIKAPVIILAGGDLRIKLLQSASSPAPAITLISATGTVSIEASQGFSTLNILNALPFQIPSGLMLQENKLIPSKIPYLLFGLSIL